MLAWYEQIKFSVFKKEVECFFPFKGRYQTKHQNTVTSLSQFSTLSIMFFFFKINTTRYGNSDSEYFYCHPLDHNANSGSEYIFL